MCGCVLFIKPWHPHGTFLSFLEMDKTAGPYSLQIYDYLSQIQREMKVFLLIARHSTEDHEHMTGSDDIACSFSSSDCRIEST